MQSQIKLPIKRRNSLPSSSWVTVSEKPPVNGKRFTLVQMSIFQLSDIYLQKIRKYMIQYECAKYIVVLNTGDTSHLHKIPSFFSTMA